MKASQIDMPKAASLFHIDSLDNRLKQDSLVNLTGNVTSDNTIAFLANITEQLA